MLEKRLQKGPSSKTAMREAMRKKDLKNTKKKYQTSQKTNTTPRAPMKDEKYRKAMADAQKKAFAAKRKK